MSRKYNEFLKNLRATFRRKGHNLSADGVLSFKGSGYKGKGSINTEDKTFNKNRKT